MIFQRGRWLNKKFSMTWLWMRRGRLFSMALRVNHFGWLKNLWMYNWGMEHMVSTTWDLKIYFSTMYIFLLLRILDLSGCKMYICTTETSPETILLYIYIHMYKYMYTYIIQYIGLHIYIYYIILYIYIYIILYIYIYILYYIYIYIYTHVYAYIHIYIYIYIYIHCGMKLGLAMCVFSVNAPDRCFFGPVDSPITGFLLSPKSSKIKPF